MHLITLLQAAILGVIEGLTEFLPISSTGHLIIAGDLLGFNGEREKTFSIFIQLGAILGVVWHYRVKVADLIVNAAKPAERRFILNLFIAFLPAAMLGLLLHRFIKAHLFDSITVASALIAGGVVILLIERFPRRVRIESIDDLRPLDALKVGIAQGFSLFPGVSRAGATIMGGLLAGLSRRAATEFSFFLAMPTMFAAVFYDLFRNLHLLRLEDFSYFAVGFVLAYVTALIVVRAFLGFISHHTFVPFAWYRIAFGLVVLAYFW